MVSHGKSNLTWGTYWPKHAQTGDQPPFLPIPRYAEQVVAATLGPAEAPDSDAVRRNLEAKGLELTELEFTLREVELNSDRLQQYLEQSQSNLEMQTEEKLGSQQTSVSPVWERELVQEVLIRLWRIFSWI